MTGLEQRGVRPEPETRGALSVFIYQRLDRAWRLASPMIAHEMFWGVPCGPTLSMAHPPQLRGIQLT